jgi:hypothetical protein
MNPEAPMSLEDELNELKQRSHRRLLQIRDLKSAVRNHEHAHKNFARIAAQLGIAINTLSKLANKLHVKHRCHLEYNDADVPRSTELPAHEAGKCDCHAALAREAMQKMQEAFELHKDTSLANHGLLEQVEQEEI